MSPPDHSYTEPQRRRILQIARLAVGRTLSGGRPLTPAIADGDGYLREPRGCFVTLNHRYGHLRGCIGTFESARPLLMNLVRMAAAATRDLRFVHQPVVLAEINDLVIEVSVLTPLRRLDDPLRMELGVDGIVIEGRRDGRPVRGCFLPQVAVEQGWDTERTLTACCAQKMGLPEDAWRTDPSLAFFVFRSIVIAESALPLARG